MAIKTEHGGAKNGGGYYGPRSDAKRVSRGLRRKADKDAVAERSSRRSQPGATMGEGPKTADELSSETRPMAKRPVRGRR